MSSAATALGTSFIPICRVRLVASVPGAHTGLNMHKWGHMKLRKVQPAENGLENDHDL